jgi:putative inorganic carbon (HCO3(-)) transporter
MLERRLMTAVSIAALGLIPVLIDRAGYDPWRLPKEILFRASAIVGALLLVLATLARQVNWRRLQRQKSIALLLGAIVVWAIVTTALSSNRTLSVDALVTTVASAILFLLFYFSFETKPQVFAVLLAGAVINAVIVVLQRFDIWNFLDPKAAEQWDTGHRLMTTGLLGNANDAGSFLSLAVLTAVVLAVVSGGKHRLLAIAVAIFLAIALAATETLTAIAAASAGIVPILIPRLRQRTTWLAVLIIVAIALAVSVSNEALRGRFYAAVASLKAGRYATAISGRAIPFIAATRMFIDHPIRGVGPGCFKYHFYQYKIAAERDYPNLQHAQMRMFNFGEVHNDHLQIAAETGIVGYILFLAANVAFVIITRQAKSSEPEMRFAREAGLAFPAAFLVLALAQFPLELAATRIVLVGIYGICCSWSTH